MFQNLKLACKSSVFICATLLFFSCNKEEGTLSTLEIADKVIEKGLEKVDIEEYPGSFLLHAMSEYALTEGSTESLEKIRDIFKKFNSKELVGKGNFISYEPGGSGAAYLWWKGVAPEVEKQVAEAAVRFFEEQKRSDDGLMTSRHAKNGLNQVFIDVALAVTPYLLYSGLKMDNPEYVDFAVFETLELFKIFEDKETGLLHQARGFTGLDVITEDNWSRGNGWGVVGLATLVRDLPKSHPKYPEVVALAKRYYKSVLNFQNSEGLWHQEMTDFTSYVETSGSGILLYGLGVMIEKGVLSKKYIKHFKKGIMGLTSYIGSDGSVSHTCRGCLAPGKGKKEDYRIHPWIYNDSHAFGPVVLAFTQAAKLGIDKISPLHRLGLHSIIDSPDVLRAYVTFERGVDVAWENDRIAFRVFGPTVRGKVKNGIDVWAKSVEYPILDKWYKLSTEGSSYHVDKGEGCDFYNMGKLSGCGGLSLWIDNKPYSPETYDNYSIISSQNDKLSFRLIYRTWDLPEPMRIEQRKVIEMELGTNLFKVTEELRSPKKQKLTVAIGLTTYGKAEVVKDKKRAILSVWEEIKPEHGFLGSAVVLDPADFLSFAEYGNDQFVLMEVETNVPFTYYAGAGWSKSKFFKTQEDWLSYLQQGR